MWLKVWWDRKEKLVKIEGIKNEGNEYKKSCQYNFDSTNIIDILTYENKSICFQDILKVKIVNPEYSWRN